MTKGFDEEYAKTGARLWTLQHIIDRYEFQRSVAEWMLQEFKDKPGDIASISTMTVVPVLNGVGEIGIDATSTFNRPYTDYERRCMGWSRPLF